jgi:hypothetical protein
LKNRGRRRALRTESHSSKEKFGIWDSGFEAVCVGIWAQTVWSPTANPPAAIRPEGISLPCTLGCPLTACRGTAEIRRVVSRLACWGTEHLPATHAPSVSSLVANLRNPFWPGKEQGEKRGLITLLDGCIGVAVPVRGVMYPELGVRLPDPPLPMASSALDDWCFGPAF